ncbi:MAG: efflux RND transporter periplasmic adaptor subunit [Treponema sp.]|nr:efflux RND transporter periplasmic adaptor subunit [Treponema sp.]
MGSTRNGTKAAVIIIAIAAAAAAIFLISRTGKKGGGADMKRGGEETVFTVRSAAAETAVLTDYVITNGEVESQSSIEVFPSMGGKIAGLNVTLGSRVRKDEVIATVDPSEPGTTYSLSPVLAPIGGSIVSSPLKVGTQVYTTTAITMIGDINNLQITALIPERYVAELKPGLKAEISLEAYPGVIFPATLSRVSPVVDAATRTKEVILHFDRNDSRVNAGMFAKIKLYTTRYSGQIAVPSDAVVAQDEDSYLFVVNDDGTVSRRTVALGKAVDSLVQITAGLAPGERVVVEGMTSLSDGARVNDISQRPQTEAGGETEE